MTEVKTLEQLHRRRNERGFTMIELLIAVVVIAVAAAAVFATWTLISAGQTAQNEAQTLVGMVAETRGLYSAQGNFTGVTPTVLIGARLVPESMSVDANTLNSSWNEEVLVQPVGPGDRELQITYEAVPVDVCTRFVQRSEAAFRLIDVNGTIVKNTPAGIDELDATALAEGCAGGPGAVVFTAGLRG